MPTINTSSVTSGVLKYVVVGVLIFALDSLGVFTVVKRPVEQFLISISVARNQVVNIVDIPIDWLRFYRSGSKQLINLESRLAEAIVDKAELEQLRQENQDMRALLESKVSPSLDFMPAKVLGTKNQLLMIDKGSVDGISSGMSVVYQDVFIGQTAEVQSHISQVLTIQSRNSKVAVTIVDKRINGLLVSQDNVLKLVQVLQSEKLEVGDIVSTSGLDNITPNLVVGTITKINENDQGIHQEATIEPPIDYSVIQNVFIVEN